MTDYTNLKIGDIVRLNKKGLKVAEDKKGFKYKGHLSKNTRLIVDKVYGLNILLRYEDEPMLLTFQTADCLDKLDVSEY